MKYKTKQIVQHVASLTLARNLWWNVGQSRVDRLRYSRHWVFGSRDRLFQISVKWTEQGGAGWGWSTVQSNNEQIMKVWVTGPQHSHMPSNIAISEADACFVNKLQFSYFYAGFMLIESSWKYHFDDNPICEWMFLHSVLGSAEDSLKGVDECLGCHLLMQSCHNLF